MDLRPAEGREVEEREEQWRMERRGGEERKREEMTRGNDKEQGRNINPNHKPPRSLQLFSGCTYISVSLFI